MDTTPPQPTLDYWHVWSDADGKRSTVTTYSIDLNTHGLRQ